MPSYEQINPASSASSSRSAKAPGWYISFIFTDAGEPGIADTAQITILDPDGRQVLEIAGPLTFGNHQAHSN